MTSAIVRPKTSARGLLTRGIAILALMAALPVAGAAERAMPSQVVSVSEWAGNVWRSALSGDAQGALHLMESLPVEHESEPVRALRQLVDRRNKHVEDAEATRVERAGKAREELAKAVEESHLLEALRSAVELHALTPASERAALLVSPAFTSLVREAEQKARDAERNGEWLDSQELFYRLHLLFEDDARYRPDVERVGRRLMMLRLYTPALLHKMRNDQRVREGEDPLPPFNAMGEDWRVKLEGVNRSMSIRALNTAHSAQVDGADMARMLLGGLNALRTMATTPDLSDAFPGLGNEASAQELVRVIDEEQRRISTRVGRASYFDLTTAIDNVLRANDRSVRMPEAAVLHEFANGAMETLDEFSGIIWPDELRRFQRNTQGRFIGVGIQISLDDAMRLTVVTPLEGTPAQRAGIRRGDVISEVDGESTLGISLNQAVDRITGEEGTMVRLTVEREGAEAPLGFDIRRAEIPVYSVKGWQRLGAREDEWDWFVDSENRIGYLRLTQFTENTTQEMLQAVNQMRRTGLNGLIMDLRFNPGGLLNEAVSVANLFVDDGVIVSQHDAAGVQTESQHARAGFARLDGIPVVVLVNEGSASASEIVAGCLQDYKKAILVGARTFGKGSVQNVYPLSGGRAALKLTTQYYHLPKGRLIHRRDGAAEWGVEPDVIVPMLPQQVSDAILLRMDADVMPLDENGQVAAKEGEERPDPTRLLTEGIDPQLETALLLIQSQSLARSTGHAMLTGIPARGS